LATWQQSEGTKNLAVEVSASAEWGILPVDASQRVAVQKGGNALKSVRDRSVPKLNNGSLTPEANAFDVSAKKRYGSSKRRVKGVLAKDQEDALRA
jgi:hypothetical protein